MDDILLGINKDKQGVLYAVDDYYEIVYYSSKTYDETKFRNIRNTMMDLEPNSKTNLRSYTNYNNTYRYYETYIDCCNLHIYYQQPIASLFEMKNNIISIIVVFGALTFLLCMLLSVSLSNYFYQPLKRIKNAITEIKKGNYNFKVDVESQDEFGELSKQFNSMSVTIQENMQQSVLRERELSETQIQMMQAQLNPHFLFNTLDTLKWIGKANDLPEIVTLSAGLAHILRMSISEGQMIHLSDEISLVEAYVDVQKIRFSDMFELIVDLPKEYENFLVPKLFLQPLVENSILHGFAECERGMVLIQGNINEENQLKIQVKDDGKGMSPEELIQMNLSSLDKIRDVSKEANIHKKSRRSIGLYNVNAMIKLRFGNEYGLHVQSTEGIGTTITILLPILKEET